MKENNDLKLVGFWVNTFFSVISFCIVSLTVFVVCAWMEYFNLLNGPYVKALDLTIVLGIIIAFFGISPWQLFNPKEVPIPMFISAVVSALMSILFVLTNELS